MPVYEYECQACHREFEYQQRMSDPDKTVCEACGGALERLISRTAFQLKGGGWYKDLYASSKPAAEGAKSTAESGTAGESASGGDKGGGDKGGGDKGGGDKGGSSDGGGGTTSSSDKPKSSGAASAS
jgi:putative FmdB family regulatory protein